MQLARFIARRLLIAAVTLWLISILVFLVVEILPGDVARLRLGQFATPEDIALVREELGLDRPLPVRYADWATGFVTGDWGETWRTGLDIGPLMREHLLNSFILAGLALVVVVPLSVLAGILAALRRGKPIDRVITFSGMFGFAIPEFVSSMFLVLLFSLWLDIVPSTATSPRDGPVLDGLKSLILPVAALAFVLFGYISRMVRASMIVELRSPYVRSAVLKGLPMRTVVFKHALRNALLPAVTVIANQIAWLVGGIVVVEAVFNYPGVGELLVESATGQDVPLLEATVFVFAAILMLANLAADIAYGLLNPRIRVQGAAQ